MHRNIRGQSFVHIAAARFNVWALRFAAAGGLTPLFSLADGEGRSPRMLLEQHVAAREAAAGLPAGAGPVRRSTALPDWFPLGAFQPPGPDSAPPFSDVIVEVEDGEKGCVRLHAHRAILAANSAPWHEALSFAAKASGSSDAVLKLDPQTCRSAEVAMFALRFLYTGDLAAGSFRQDAAKLLQLLRLAATYGLPAGLRLWAIDELLAQLASSSTMLVPNILCEARRLSLPQSARQVLARLVISNDDAWREATCGASIYEESGSDNVLGLALAELEHEGGISAPSEVHGAPNHTSAQSMGRPRPQAWAAQATQASVWS